MNILEVQNLCKTYGKGEAAVQALRDVTFSVHKGEFVAIVGESGSGKSTLLNVVGALDNPTAGKVLIDTINMGVIAKTKQYGTMRAIGMSNQQLIKMIVAEAMTYAVSGIILGCIIGLPMHWVVFASLITNFWGTAWSIPIFPLALIIGIVLFTSFLAVRSPAKRLHDMAIVDTIKSQQ